jgi:hypothetical protein
VKAERSRAKTDVTAARTTQKKAEQTAKELHRVQIGLEKERKARSDELRKAKARASDLEKANKDAADKEAAASPAEAAREELEAARKESEVVNSGAPNGMGRNGDGQSAIAFDTFMKSDLISYSRNLILLGIDFCLSVRLLC